LNVSIKLANLWPVWSSSPFKPKEVTTTPRRNSSRSSSASPKRSRCFRFVPKIAIVGLILSFFSQQKNRMEQLSSSTRSKQVVELLANIGATSTSTCPNRRISSRSVRRCSPEVITVCLNSGRNWHPFQSFVFA
jgi:hypothetical protein